jgi:uroporphyrinogen decarboxylase
MIEPCAHETLLNCINPLEIPPMGDMTLSEAKQLVRDTNLSLMGNLHTTDVMLNPDVTVVQDAAKQAILDAGTGGGFVLSTGDQCGWDTPDENIFALVETARTYGVYE